MKRALIAFGALALMTSGCSRKSKQPVTLQATAKGTAIVESSGGKQIGYIGMPLDQPIVVQVNDASGSGVAGAAVYLSGPSGVALLARLGTDRFKRAGHQHGLARPASRAIQNRRQHPGCIWEKSATPAGRNRARLPANHGSAAQRAILHSLPRSGVDAAAGLKHGQSVGKAASLYRGGHAQQDQRCGPDCHYQPRWSGSEQIGRNAALGIHAFQERHSCAGFLYSRGS